MLDNLLLIILDKHGGAFSLRPLLLVSKSAEQSVTVAV